MKTLCKVMFLLLMCLFADTGMRAETNNPTPPPQKPAGNPRRINIGRVKTDAKMRPQAPSRQRIECLYEDGSIFISFYLPEGEAVITISDMESGTLDTQMFDTSEPAQVYVGELNSATIEIDTEAGYSYEGYLE